MRGGECVHNHLLKKARLSDGLLAGRLKHYQAKLLHIVGKQALFSQRGKARARAAPVGKRMNGDAAARGEFAEYFDVFGLHQRDQIFHDNVDTVFMKIAVVAEAEQIKLERFALHHLNIGNVADINSSEIGLAGHRAQAGEFGADEFHKIIVARVFVGKGFEHFGGIIGTVFGVLIAKSDKPPSSSVLRDIMDSLVF